MSSQIPSIFSRYFNIYLPNEVEMRTLQGSRRPYTGMVMLPFFRVPVCVSWSSVSLMHLTCLLCSSRISFISLLRRGTPCHRGLEAAPQISAGAAPLVLRQQWNASSSASAILNGENFHFHFGETVHTCGLCQLLPLGCPQYVHIAGVQLKYIIRAQNYTLRE